MMRSIAACANPGAAAVLLHQCLVLQYQNHQNYTEEFTFYPESESHSGPASSSLINRFSRSKSTPLPDGGERDSVDFEEVRASMGARSEAAKRCEYCALAARHFAPLHIVNAPAFARS